MYQTLKGDENADKMNMDSDENDESYDDTITNMTPQSPSDQFALQDIQNNLPPIIPPIAEKDAVTKADDEDDSMDNDDNHVTKSTVGEIAEINGNMNNNELSDMNEGNNEYQWIENALKKCDSIQWSMYLNKFKQEQITDTRIKLIPYDDNVWEKLLPKLGIRYEFKDLCKKRNQQWLRNVMVEFCT